MPRSRSDDFLATGRFTAARPGQVLDVVVLTSDKGLLEVLRATAGSEHALWNAPSADAAVDNLVGGQCDILIADLGSLRGDVASLIERLQAQFPEVILMATGRREEEGLVAAQLSSGRIYRFLHKPISPARASQFLNAATRRYNELHDVAPSARRTTVRTTTQRPHISKVLAGVLGALAAVVVFAIWHSQRDELPATLQRLQVGDSPLEDRIKSKLGSAQIAYLSGRLAQPRGDNALDYYKEVLAMEPDNAEAEAGVQKVIDGLEARVTKAMQDRNAPQVVKAWTALQRAAPDHPRLDAMRIQLLALSRSTRPAGAGAARPRTAPVKAPAQRSNQAALTEADLADRELAEAIQRELAQQQARGAADEEQVAAGSAPRGATLADEIDAAIELRERGALVAPAGSNAYERVMALRERYPNAEEVRSEQQRLAFVLLDRSRAALAENSIDEAATFIDRANTLVPGMTAIRTLQEQLSEAQQQQDFMKNVAQAASLKRTREVAPVYPREAERNRIEGWVQLEFTIAPDGSTKNLSVVNAEPRAVFDKAAMDSVKRWRFEPVRKNGSPVDQRAALLVKFVLRE